MMHIQWKFGSSNSYFRKFLTKMAYNGQLLLMADTSKPLLRSENMIYIRNVAFSAFRDVLLSLLQSDQFVRNKCR